MVMPFSLFVQLAAAATLGPTERLVCEGRSFRGLADLAAQEACLYFPAERRAEIIGSDRLLKRPLAIVGRWEQSGPRSAWAWVSEIRPLDDARERPPAAWVLERPYYRHLLRLRGDADASSLDLAPQPWRAGRPTCRPRSRTAGHAPYPRPDGLLTGRGTEVRSDDQALLLSPVEDRDEPIPQADHPDG